MGLFASMDQLRYFHIAMASVIALIAGLFLKSCTSENNWERNTAYFLLLILLASMIGYHGYHLENNVVAILVGLVIAGAVFYYSSGGINPLTDFKL